MKTKGCQGGVNIYQQKSTNNIQVLLTSKDYREGDKKYTDDFCDTKINKIHETEPKLFTKEQIYNDMQLLCYLIPDKLQASLLVPVLKNFC